MCQEAHVLGDPEPSRVDRSPHQGHSLCDVTPHGISWNGRAVAATVDPAAGGTSNYLYLTVSTVRDATQSNILVGTVALLAA